MSNLLKKMFPEPGAYDDLMAELTECLVAVPEDQIADLSFADCLALVIRGLAPVFGAIMDAQGVADVAIRDTHTMALCALELVEQAVLEDFRKGLN